MLFQRLFRIFPGVFHHHSSNTGAIYFRRIHSVNYTIQKLVDMQNKAESSSDPWSKLVPPSDVVVDQCVRALQRGGVIAVPTDTIYGFAVSALNSEAIEKLYALKGREKTKPIAICVGGPSDVDRWGDVCPCAYYMESCVLQFNDYRS